MHGGEGTGRPPPDPGSTRGPVVVDGPWDVVLMPFSPEIVSAPDAASNHHRHANTTNPREPQQIAKGGEFGPGANRTR